MSAEEIFNKIIDEIEQIIRTLPDQFAEKGPKCNKIAEQAFIRANYPAIDKARDAIFKLLMNKTSTQYIDARRMNEIYRILIDTPQWNYGKNSHIFLVISGSSDQSNFCTKFKTYFEKTPKEAFDDKDASLLMPPTYWEDLKISSHPTKTEAEISASSYNGKDIYTKFKIASMIQKNILFQILKVC